MTRPTYASLNWNHLRHNYQHAKALAGGTAYAVVKANAYGHGLAACAQALSDADGFAVACVDEALQLRKAGIQRPILVLQGAYSSSEWQQACAEQLQLVIHHEQQLADCAQAQLKQPIQVLLKLNSGMNRVGFSPEVLPAILDKLSQYPQLHLQAILSHFSCADEPSNPAFQQQLERIQAQPWPVPVSLSNSAALFRKHELAHYPSEYTARPGIMLYGASPFAHKTAAQLNLKPVLCLHSQVISIHKVAAGEYVGYGRTWQASSDSTVAVIAIGYGDGYPRTAPTGTPVWIAGKRCPLVGRVSMDMITVDISQHPEVVVGSEVELWGEHIAVDEIAALSGTIGYELLCQITPRVRRLTR